jgi:hypothetical protein
MHRFCFMQTALSRRVTAGIALASVRAVRDHAAFWQSWSVGQVQPSRLRPYPGASRTCGGLQHARASLYPFRGALARDGTKSEQAPRVVSNSGWVLGLVSLVVKALLSAHSVWRACVEFRPKTGHLSKAVFWPPENTPKESPPCAP